MRHQFFHSHILHIRFKKRSDQIFYIKWIIWFICLKFCLTLNKRYSDDFYNSSFKAFWTCSCCKFDRSGLEQIFKFWFQQHPLRIQSVSWIPFQPQACEIVSMKSWKAAGFESSDWIIKFPLKNREIILRPITRFWLMSARQPWARSNVGLIKLFEFNCKTFAIIPGTKDGWKLPPLLLTWAARRLKILLSIAL